MSGLDPHYLHQRRGLEPVVSPPVDGVVALAWHPRREELYAATRGGALTSIDPVMGTRTLAEGLPEAGALAVSPDGRRVAVLGRAGPLQVRSLEDGAVLAQVPLTIISDLWVGFWSGGVVASGRTLERRELRVFDEACAPRGTGALPEGAVAGVDEDGHVLLGRVSSAGPEVVRLGRGRLGRRTPTSHRLRFGRGGLLYGVAEGGVTLWPPGGGAPLTVRMFGVSAAAVSDDGLTVAIGTREGEVATAAVVGSEALARAHPGRTGGHDQVVRTVAFSHRGRWLATVGERTWLWSW